MLPTTVGARGGRLRRTPLIRVTHGGVCVAVPSMGGGHPHWYAAIPAAGLGGDSLRLARSAELRGWV